MRFLILLFFISSQVSAQQKGNAYFDQKQPGNAPVVFAPGIISDEYGNRDMAISPAGDEIFFTLQYQSGRGFSTIMHTKKVNGKWTKPEVASFCGVYNDLEPAFSPDGNRLYYVSNRTSKNIGVKDYDIWYVTKTAGSWGNAINIGAPVNTTANEYYPSIAKSGNIYFTRAMDGKGEDIVMCAFRNNTYDTAVSLPAAVNSIGDEFNAFVDPDENFIIFTGYERSDAFGAGDLYISRKNSNGEWMTATNLGDIINRPGLNYCPYISPDKKYFFFTAGRGGFKTPFDKKQDRKSFYGKMHQYLNGYDNIYWMSAEKILKQD
ncbi:MAG: hypothetical protein QM791_14495 [Ferruginibacter sp.]